MTKTELIEQVAKTTGLSKAASEKAVNAVIESITMALKKKDKVTLTGFGTFLVSRRKAKKGVNPQNPDERITIPAANVPKFKPGKALKEAVGGKKKKK